MVFDGVIWHDKYTDNVKEILKQRPELMKEIEDKIREQQDKKEQKKNIKSETTRTVIPAIVADIKGLDKAVKAKEKVILGSITLPPRR